MYFLNILNTRSKSFEQDIDTEFSCFVSAKNVFWNGVIAFM